METAALVLHYLNTATFVLLAVAGALVWRRRRDRASFWFFATFFILAWVTVVGEFMGDQRPEGLLALVARIDLALLAAFPFALYEFVGTFRQAHMWERRFVSAVLTVLVVWSLLIDLPAEGEDRSFWFGMFTLLFVGHWAATLLLIMRRLWRAGREEPRAARRRISMIGIGAGLMAGAIVLAGVAGSLPEREAEAVGFVTQILSLGSALSFVLGYVPPYILRVLWRVPAEGRLRESIAELIRAEDVEGLAESLLPAVCDIAGGRGAALLDRDGTVTATHGGVVGDDIERVREDATQHGLRGSEVWVLPGSSELSITAISFPAGHLLIWTSPFTPFFGTEEFAMLRSLGAVTDLARDHVHLLERERQTAQRLREVNELKDEFVALVAHDLRSPMTVISGFADTIVDRWDTLPEADKLEYLGLVSRNTKRLSRLVEDVLQVARIESGEYNYDIARFDMKRLVERTIAEITSATPRHITLTVLDPVPPVLGDESRQWQVLTNLLSNAMKFSPDDQPVEVRLEPGGSELLVSVHDHGEGIDAEDQKRLFRKFSRIANGQKAPGTGLGLYICKSLVEAQGGRIWVESAHLQGTTFRFTVPVAEVPVGRERP